MNNTTKQNLLDVIEEIEQHTQDDLLSQLEKDFLEKVHQISHLLNSDEGTRIYWNSQGRRHDRLQLQRIILQTKMYTLFDVCEKIIKKKANR